MKKKYVTMAIAALLACGFTSCNDWLDIEQNTEKKADHMFENYDGFKGALAGCYSDLTNSNLYGTRLTITDIEALANLWVLDVSNNNLKGEMRTSAYFREHDYTHSTTETAIRDIYLAFYNTILEANMVIKGVLENGNNIPDSKSRAVIEGEAYAIRAFCHFDILRLFGQLPVGAITQVQLPYSEVTSIEDKLVYYSFDEYVKKLKSDFEKAESLLKDNDPACDYTFDELNNVGAEGYEDISISDDFMYMRQYRMNYWAVRALQARLYMYLGDLQTAHSIALEVINAETTAGEKVAELTSLKDYGFPVSEESETNPRLYNSPSECLFGLYIKDLGVLSTSLLGDKTIHAFPDQNFLLSENMWQDLYRGLDGASDIRMLYLWTLIQTSQQEKYYMTQKYTMEDGGIIPIIRMSEVYLIAVESATTLEEANRLYAEYLRSKSSIAQTYTSMDELKAELTKEYRREFFGEGVMFYYYKRNNMKTLWSSEDYEMREADYILPLPNTEHNPNNK